MGECVLPVGNRLSAPEPSALLQTGEGRQDPRISVCHIASGDLWAGAESQLAGLVAALGQRKDLRLHLILFNEGRLAEEVRRCGLEPSVLPEGRMSFPRLAFEAARLLKGRDIEILHSHGYKSNVLAAILGRACHIPFVLRTEHGFPEPFGGYKRMKQKLFRGVDRWVARHRTDRVICVSEEMRSQLSSKLGANRVVTIHNGLNPDRVHSSLTVAEAKERLGVSRSDWLLGSAGRLEPIKRFDLFLSAAIRMAPSLPNAKFVIAGEGGEGLRLRAMAASAGLGDSFRLLGHRNDIYDVLRALDVFVLCSDHEGIPMALLEALYLGLPVVARCVGGVSEVIRRGENGILLDSGDPQALADACLSVLKDESLRQRLAQEGPRSVEEEFTVARTAEAVFKLYASLGGANPDHAGEARLRQRLER